MYWNQVSPENAGKWGSVQPASQSSFNWTSLDAMYKYANDHNIIFKQHNFIWGSQQPSWTDNLTTSTGPAAVQNWMRSFCQRYPNTKIIDVVNEPPPHTTPKYANAIGGGTNTTWDWIANAFKWARDACPNAILVLNDYNNDELSGDTQHTIDIVTAIKKLGAPINAVGCQTHGASNLPSSTLKTNIDKIASSTGLPVYITEYDINLADDAKQQQKYQDHFTMFWNDANVKGITIWGYIVGSTWETNSGIMQSNGTMRPAMSWLMNFLGR
jgi:endo-1,4-beta-xylanase